MKLSDIVEIRRPTDPQRLDIVKGKAEDYAKRMQELFPGKDDSIGLIEAVKPLLKKYHPGKKNEDLTALFDLWLNTTFKKTLIDEVLKHGTISPRNVYTDLQKRYPGLDTEDQFVQCALIVDSYCTTGGQGLTH